MNRWQSEPIRARRAGSNALDVYCGDSLDGNESQMGFLLSAKNIATTSARDWIALQLGVLIVSFLLIYNPYLYINTENLR